MKVIQDNPPNLQRDAGAIVVVGVQQLRAIVAEAVAEALGDARPAKAAPALLDRKGLAHALGVSASSVDRLIREGAPCTRIGDAPRFRLERVLAWLDARAAGGPTHSIAGGARRDRPRPEPLG